MDNITLDRLVKAHLTKRYAMIEKAIEQAIQGGACGVYMIEGPGMHFEVRVDPEVPYGHIHHHQRF